MCRDDSPRDEQAKADRARPILDASASEGLKHKRPGLLGESKDPIMECERHRVAFHLPDETSGLPRPCSIALSITFDTTYASRSAMR
jgi:hypothetical protein